MGGGGGGRVRPTHPPTHPSPLKTWLGSTSATRPLYISSKPPGSPSPGGVWSPIAGAGRGAGPSHPPPGNPPLSQAWQCSLLRGLDARLTLQFAGDVPHQQCSGQRVGQRPPVLFPGARRAGVHARCASAHECVAGRSLGNEAGTILVFSLRTAAGQRGQDSVHRRRLTLNRRRLTLNRRRVAGNRPRSLAGRRSAEVRAYRRPPALFPLKNSPELWVRFVKGS